MQKTILIGNLGKEPELRKVNGTPVCNFSVATTERWKDQQGERQERTEWHNIVAWGDLATICSNYLTKGSKVYIEGKNKTRKWTDKNKTDRYITEIHAKEMQLLAGVKNGSATTGDEVPDFSGDVPF